jgi:hypothetical protein
VAQAAGGKQACGAVAAILDPLYVAAGLVLRAVDAVLLGREQWWNFRSIDLAGGPTDVADTVLPRSNCQLCRASSSMAHEQGH